MTILKKVLIAIYVEYDSEDLFFTRWLYKLNTTELTRVNRSQYGKGTDFKFVEY